MKKKYELTNETKTISVDGVETTLHRIRALRDGRYFRAGVIGGWVESENNLSHEGDCWIYADAIVYDNAQVSGSSTISQSTVCDYAIVVDSTVDEDSTICGHARIIRSAVCSSTIRDYAHVERAECEGCTIYNDADVIDVFVGADIEIGTDWQDDYAICVHCRALHLHRDDCGCPQTLKRDWSNIRCNRCGKKIPAFNELAADAESANPHYHAIDVIVFESGKEVELENPVCERCAKRMGHAL